MPVTKKVKAQKETKRRKTKRMRDYGVTIAEATRRIGTKPYVHTFMSSPIALIGTDWERAEVIRVMKKFGVENSGGMASGMGHTLVIRDYKPSPLFIEAEPAEAEK